MQQRITDGEGSRNSKNDLCERLTRHEREHHHFDLTMFYQNRFWNRRLDDILMNKNHRTLYTLEFKRSSGRNEDFLGVKEDEANEQHKSIIEALKAAALE